MPADKELHWCDSCSHVWVDRCQPQSPFPFPDRPSISHVSLFLPVAIVLLFLVLSFLLFVVVLLFLAYYFSFSPSVYALTSCYTTNLPYTRSSRVEVTRAVLNQGKRFVAVMALDSGDLSFLFGAVFGAHYRPFAAVRAFLRCSCAPLSGMPLAPCFTSSHFILLDN